MITLPILLKEIVQCIGQDQAGLYNMGPFCYMLHTYHFFGVMWFFFVRRQQSPPFVTSGAQHKGDFQLNQPGTITVSQVPWYQAIKINTVLYFTATGNINDISDFTSLVWKYACIVAVHCCNSPAIAYLWWKRLIIWALESKVSNLMWFDKLWHASLPTNTLILLKVSQHVSIIFAVCFRSAYSVVPL